MLTKNHLIFVLLIAVLLLSMFAWDRDKGFDIIQDSYNRIENELEVNKTKLQEQIQISALRRDSIEYWKNKRDTIVITIEKDRKKSSGKIKEAKSVTEDTAKAKVWERFKNFKEIHVFATISDSIKLELRGITEINKALQQELLQSSKMATSLDSTITLLTEQIELKGQTISLKDTELDILKKDRPRLFLKGVGIGIGIGAIGACILLF